MQHHRFILIAVFACCLLNFSAGAQKAPPRVTKSALVESTGSLAPDGTVPDLAAFTPDQVEQGKHNLNVACSRCHGKDGFGGKGPDLTDGVWRHAKNGQRLTDAELVDIISNGISGTGMIGLGETFRDFYLPMVAYIRSEEKKANGRRTVPEGDVHRGRALFLKHQCNGCHWLGGSGGRIGTNLTDLAAAPDYVRGAMRSPDSQIDGTHQRVHLLGKEEQILAGKRLAETTYDILIMDSSEHLHSIRKDDLARIEYVQSSLMPSYQDQLTPQEIEDIATFLLAPPKEDNK